MSATKRIVVYYRVSTTKQDIESQKIAINGWLKGLAHLPEKIITIEDIGFSGRTHRRPGFKKLMNMAINKEIDTIVVYRLDRFSRNATMAIKLLLELDEYGVGFVSVTQPILSLGHDNPFRRTILAAFAEIAEIERETIVARVKSGLEAAKKRGVKLGAPKKATPKKIAHILSLRQQGQNYQCVAKEVGLSVGLVHKIVVEQQAAPS